jgi:hypothetical protein
MDGLLACILARLAACMLEMLACIPVILDWMKGVMDYMPAMLDEQAVMDDIDISAVHVWTHCSPPETGQETGSPPRHHC